ncbi:hypothetical protein ACOMHN_019019 [Nucella lapillus]
MSGPPPPYPGAEGAYPPPNPGYPGPYDAKMGAPPPAAYGAPPPPGSYPAYGAPPPPGSYPGQPAYGQPPYGQPAYGQPVQPGYGPSGQTTVVVTQPALAVVQTFRESPVHTRCPHCQAEVVTGTQYETGTFTWIICFILCLVGCDFGCCLIPFCVDGCKDVIHSCPNCRQQVARWSRM